MTRVKHGVIPINFWGMTQTMSSTSELICCQIPEVLDTVYELKLELEACNYHVQKLKQTPSYCLCVPVFSDLKLSL